MNLRSTGLSAFVAVTLALVIAGCGAPANPFAGTWRQNEMNMTVVISEQADGFFVATVVDTHTIGPFLLTRNGNRLARTLPVLDPSGQPTGTDVKVSVQYRPASHDLLYNDGGPTVELHRTGDGTAMPTNVASP